jgi:hypothetical protein
MRSQNRIAQTAREHWISTVRSNVGFPGYTVTSLVGSRTTKLARADKVGIRHVLTRLGISESDQSALLLELQEKRTPASVAVELSDEVATAFGCDDN